MNDERLESSISFGIKKIFNHQDYSLTTIQEDERLTLEVLLNGQKYTRVLTNNDIQNITKGNLFSALNDIRFLADTLEDIHSPNFDSDHVSFDYLIENNTFIMRFSHQIKNTRNDGNKIKFEFEIAIPDNESKISTPMVYSKCFFQKRSNQIMILSGLILLTMIKWK